MSNSDSQLPAERAKPVAWQYAHKGQGDWHMLRGGADPTEWLKKWPGIEYDVRPLYAAPVQSLAQTETPAYRDTVRQIAAVREKRMAELVAALTNIADQKTSDEIDSEGVVDTDECDFVGAYDTLILIARRVLNPTA